MNEETYVREEILDYDLRLDLNADWNQFQTKGMLQRTWHNASGDLHREDGPARIIYFSKSDDLLDIRMEEWAINGELHRARAPAVTMYDNNGDVNLQEFWKHGKLDRFSGPAVKLYREAKLTKELWYRHGVLHREYDPAVIVRGDTPGKYEKAEYWINGKFTRLPYWHFPRV